MKKSDTFTERRQEADAAKARRVDKFKAGPAQDSPEAVERAAARQAQSTAQAERNATAQLDKKNKAHKLKVEAEATEASRKAEQQSAERTRIAEDQQIKRTAEAQEVLDEASRKAKRDARYASRKALKLQS
jgi:hypothetical protein